MGGAISGEDSYVDVVQIENFEDGLRIETTGSEGKLRTSAQRADEELAMAFTWNRPQVGVTAEGRRASWSLIPRPERLGEGRKESAAVQE